MALAARAGHSTARLGPPWLALTVALVEGILHVPFELFVSHCYVTSSQPQAICNSEPSRDRREFGRRLRKRRQALTGFRRSAGMPTVARRRRQSARRDQKQRSSCEV